MAILWAVEMESQDYKTGHCTAPAKEGKEERRKKKGKKKQREREREASKTIESAEDGDGANANNANEIAPVAVLFLVRPCSSLSFQPTRV